MKKIILASATVILLIFACVPKIEEFLTVSGAADKIDIDDAGTTISLNINASQKPTVSSPVSWIGTSFKTVEKTTYTYDLIVGPNNDTLPRKALVRIASGSLSEFITINQEAKNKKQEDDGKEDNVGDMEKVKAILDRYDKNKSEMNKVGDE